MSERGGKIQQGSVVMSPKLKRTREMIDPDGNVIDPETKQVIKRNTPEDR